MFDPDASPVNALPTVVLVLAILIVVPELIFAAGSAGFGGPGASAWRQDAIREFAFAGGIVDDMALRGNFDFDRLKRFLTYPFIHITFMQALFSGVFVLALGKFVGEYYRFVAMTVIFFGASIFGAFLYGALLNDPYPLTGAFAGAYGFIGAFTYILAGRIGAQGGNQFQAFQLIGLLMGVQLLFAFIGGDLTWVADLAGFVAGFFLASVLRPGGWAALLDRMRNR